MGETFNKGIVIAVSLSAHGSGQAGVGQAGAVVGFYLDFSD
jgi:hypothetical protein